MIREKLNPYYIENIIPVILETLDRRLREKGDGLFVSSHEALGVITEEYHELVDAIQSNKRDAVMHELMDLIIASLFSYVGMYQQSCSDRKVTEVGFNE